MTEAERNLEHRISDLIARKGFTTLSHRTICKELGLGSRWNITATMKNMGIDIERSRADARLLEIEDKIKEVGHIANIRVGHIQRKLSFPMTGKYLLGRTILKIVGFGNSIPEMRQMAINDTIIEILKKQTMATKKHLCYALFKAGVKLEQQRMLVVINRFEKQYGVSVINWSKDQNNKLSKKG